MFMSLARVAMHCFFPFLESKPLRVWLSVYHQSKEAIMSAAIMIILFSQGLLIDCSLPEGGNMFC